MKTRPIKIIPVLFIITLISCQTPIQEKCQITFQVDMSDENIDDPSTVGIRGDTPPLTWTESYLMDGPNENGIYTVTIRFDSLEYGARIQYKYVHSDSIWDNDKYGENGNRLAVFCCNGEVMPVDKWNELEEYTLESRLASSSWDNLSTWIYIIGNGKKKGLSIEEIAQEVFDFWGWAPSDNDLLESELQWSEFDQAKCPYGYFEILENTPDKIEFIQNKYWEIMLYYWNEDGIVKGVTVDEMNELFRHLRTLYMDKRGWTCTWEDMDDHKEKIIVTK